MAAHPLMGPDLDLQPLGQPTAAPKPGAKIGAVKPKSGAVKSAAITRERRQILMNELTTFDARQLSVAVSNAGKADKLTETVKGALDVVFRNRLTLLAKIVAEERRLGTLQAQQAAKAGRTVTDPKVFMRARVEEVYNKTKTLYNRLPNIKFKSSKVKEFIKTLYQAQMNYLIGQISASAAAGQKTGAGAQVSLQTTYGPKSGTAPKQTAIQTPGAKPGAKPGLTGSKAIMSARARPALQKKRLVMAANATPPSTETLRLIVKLVVQRVPKRAGETDQIYFRRLLRIVQRAALITANLQTQGLSPEAAATRAVNAATHRAELAILSAELRKGIRVAGGEEILDAWLKSQAPAIAQAAAAAGAVASPAQSVPAAMAAAQQIQGYQSLQPGSFRVSSDTVSNQDYLQMSESVAISSGSGGVVRMDASGKIVQDTTASAPSFMPSEDAKTVSNLPGEEEAEAAEGSEEETSASEEESETPWYKKPASVLLGLAALGGLAYYGYKKQQSASASLMEGEEPVPDAPDTLA